MIFLYIILGYFILGPIVYAIVDKDLWLYNEQKRLNKGDFAEQIIGILFYVIWPLIVYKWIKRK